MLCMQCDFGPQMWSVTTVTTVTTVKFVTNVTFRTVFNSREKQKERRERETHTGKKRKREQDKRERERESYFIASTSKLNSFDSPPVSASLLYQLNF